MDLRRGRVPVLVNNFPAATYLWLGNSELIKGVSSLEMTLLHLSYEQICGFETYRVPNSGEVLYLNLVYRFLVEVGGL